MCGVEPACEAWHDGNYIYRLDQDNHVITAHSLDALQLVPCISTCAVTAGMLQPWVMRVSA